MAKEAVIHLRTDGALKGQAEAVFERLGINTSVAVNMFLAQVVLRDGLPFEVLVPETDIELQQRKAEALTWHRRQLREQIEEGLTDFETGRVIDGDEVERRLQHRRKARKQGEVSKSDGSHPGTR